LREVEKRKNEFKKLKSKREKFFGARDFSRGVGDGNRRGALEYKEEAW